MAKFNRRICDNCRCVFVPEFEEQQYCCRCLVEARDRKLKDSYQEMRQQYSRVTILTVACKVCGATFKRARGKVKQTCSDFCFSQLAARRPRKHKPIIDPIAEANKRWLSGEKKKTGRLLPLDVLNKMAEHKRVFDDSGWDHYCKGRKWDRI